jgi:mono/diheme cytochrome c family protein
MNAQRRLLGACVLAAIACVGLGAPRAASAVQSPVTIALPAPTATFRPAAGSEVAQRDCLSCHSSEYVTMQPALSAAAWTKEIAKMRTAYGAAIPDADVDRLVAYLVAQNPPAAHQR